MQPAKIPLTVAGQWRILTALPEHSTSVGSVQLWLTARHHLLPKLTRENP
jgi:hypothetical protein